MLKGRTGSESCSCRRAINHTEHRSLSLRVPRLGSSSRGSLCAREHCKWATTNAVGLEVGRPSWFAHIRACTTALWVAEVQNGLDAVYSRAITPWILARSYEWESPVARQRG